MNKFFMAMALFVLMGGIQSAQADLGGDSPTTAFDWGKVSLSSVPPVIPTPLSEAGWNLSNPTSTTPDNDYVKFEVITEPAEVTLYTTSTIDTYGILFIENADKTLTEVARNDDAGLTLPNRFDFKIQRLLNPGTYYIQIRGYNLSYTGPYTLTLSGPVPDDVGNTPATATTVPIYAPYTYFTYPLRAVDANDYNCNCMLTPGDVDVFKFTVPVSEYPAYAVNAYTLGTTDTWIELLDGAGQLVKTEKDIAGAAIPAQDDDSGESYNARISYPVQPGATYYLKVQGYGSTTQGAYRPIIRATPRTGRTGFSTITNPTLISWPFGAFSSQWLKAGEADVYKFTPTPFTMTVYTAARSYSDIILEVLDANGAVIATANNGLNPDRTTTNLKTDIKLSYLSQANTTYYIRVKGAWSTVGYNYTAPWLRALGTYSLETYDQPIVLPPL